MKILFAASECRPFAVSGGLADVVGSLPCELKEQGIFVSVVIPMYACVMKEYLPRLTLVKEAEIYLDWRKQNCSLYLYNFEEIDYYFLRCDRYYDRERLYGYDDDIERFAFFSKAVAELLGGEFDALHCHDWQSALITAYLKGKVKTLFTIHNIDYQGKFNLQHLRDLTGLNQSAFENIFEWQGAANLLKGAVVSCGRLTTVSPNYSREIQTKEFGAGLENIIKENNFKLSGILNGIDYKFYNPQSDDSIAQNYSYEDLSGKQKCKEHLRRRLGLKEGGDKPLFVVVSRLAHHKGFDLVAQSLPYLTQKGAQFVLLGTGEKYLEDFFISAAAKDKNISASIAFDNKLAKEIYAAADFFLMPSLSEPCGLSQMIACRYGALPVVRGVGGLFDSIREGLNGIVFYDFSRKEFEKALSRALDLYKSGGIKNAQSRAMRGDFSWKNSALSYAALYKDLLKN